MGQLPTILAGKAERTVSGARLNGGIKAGFQVHAAALATVSPRALWIPKPRQPTVTFPHSGVAKLQISTSLLSGSLRGVVSLVRLDQAKGAPMADGGFHAVHTIPPGGVQITAGSEADITLFLDRLTGGAAERDIRAIQQLFTYAGQEMAERADEYADLLGRIAVSLEGIEIAIKALAARPKA
jgi:hypothetical protein